MRYQLNMERKKKSSNWRLQEGHETNLFKLPKGSVWLINNRCEWSLLQVAKRGVNHRIISPGICFTFCYASLLAEFCLICQEGYWVNRCFKTEQIKSKNVQIVSLLLQAATCAMEEHGMILSLNSQERVLRLFLYRQSASPHLSLFHRVNRLKCHYSYPPISCQELESVK